MFFQKKFPQNALFFGSKIVFALALCFCVPATFAEPESPTKSAAREKLRAWEEMLDEIYTPDAFDPEIPFRVEKKSALSPAILEKRAAYKSKLPFVSKFKEKANPSEIDRYFAKIVPTVNDPLVLSINAKIRKEIAEKIKQYESVSARDVFPHPTARFFPGDVSDKFKRVRKPFYPDPKNDGWQCTGLYAAPGEIIKVSISKSAVGVGLRIRIGSHTDDLLASRQRYWRRFPRVTREFGVGEQSFEIASPFGGMIYVRTPKNRISGRARFIFSGAVEAPVFVLDETNLKDWENLRYAPAPWAEFVGKNFAACIPADEAVKIDNPEPIIRFWDNVVAELDKLVSGPKERSRPIRFVVDVEPATAVGHAGDPIVGNALWTRGYLDLEHIRQNGSWELFLALAKNSLNGKWVFGGDRDTPAALLALFCMERATGKKAETFFDVPALQAACFARVRRNETEEKNRKALREQAKAEAEELAAEKKKIFKDKSSGKGRRERAEAAEEADVEDTRADPGVPFQRLSAYVPVISATGWEPLAKTFKLYTVRNRLPLGNDDEKRRTFLMLWSNSTKKNLSPFFEKFGFPRQGGAGNYPDFAPENFPPDENLRPEHGGTGFLGYSPFPTIAMNNDNYRVQQLPKKTDTAGTSAFGEIEPSDASDDEADEDEAVAPEPDVPADKKPAWEPIFE